MAFNMQFEQPQYLGHVGVVNRPQRPAPPSVQPGATASPGTAPQPQPRAFTPPNDNPNAAFNREGQASENARFNRVPMAEGEGGAQYADNPRGQRPASVGAMMGGENDQMQREKAKQWVHGLMANRPDIFAELMRRRGLVPPQGQGGQGGMPVSPGGYPAPQPAPQPMPPQMQNMTGGGYQMQPALGVPQPMPSQPYAYNPFQSAPPLYNLAMPFGGGYQ